MLRFFSQVKRSARALVREESGEAVVEFIGLSVILLVPLIYAILALAQVQAGLLDPGELAGAGGAREAARVLADHPEDQATALAQVELAFADFHVPSTPSTEIGCRQCSGELRDVSVTVSTSIPLPLLPAWLGERVCMPISVTAVSLVDGVRLDG